MVEIRLNAEISSHNLLAQRSFSHEYDEFLEILAGFSKNIYRLYRFRIKTVQLGRRRPLVLVGFKAGVGIGLGFSAQTRNPGFRAGFCSKILDSGI